MRLGIFPQGLINRIKGRKNIWLHTVSVGEAQAASALVKNLKHEYPDFCLVISTVTETGNKVARKLAGPQDIVIYSPLDVSFIVKKVASIINPKLFVIAETEIWPNLIINLARKSVPVILVNGRISANSFRGYKIIRPFFKKLLRSFNLFCMQTKEDAQRIVELGAEKSKVKATGNMKFDISSSEFRMFMSSELGLKENEKLLIAGSTHRGEEEIILQAYKELVKNHSDLRLLIAPRHIERAQELERLVAKLGFRAQRFSNIGLTTNYEPQTTNPILILDTIGRLKNIYALADIVFIGGSLIPHGGQNPIEPAIFGKAILFGPYMSNFSNISEAFLNNRAAIMLKDAPQLKDACSKLLKEPILRRDLGHRAKELVQKNKGATLKNMGLIRHLLDKDI